MDSYRLAVEALKNYKRSILKSKKGKQMTETEQIDKYILDHIAPEGDYLYRLYRATNIHTIHGRMASGHLQGRLLKMLVQSGATKKCIGSGTFSGYSAICIAEGLPDDGKLYTFEIMMRWKTSPVRG